MTMAEQWLINGTWIVDEGDPDSARPAGSLRDHGGAIMPPLAWRFSDGSVVVEFWRGGDDYEFATGEIKQPGTPAAPLRRPTKRVVRVRADE